MTAVAVTLDVLALRVREAHDEVEQHGRATVAAAIRAGEALAEAKAAVQHGAWLPWLAENFPASEDTAQLYMKMAANTERVRYLNSISEARKALASPRDPDPETAQIPGQTDLVTETAPPVDLPLASDDEQATIERAHYTGGPQARTAAADALGVRDRAEGPQVTHYEPAAEPAETHDIEEVDAVAVDTTKTDPFTSDRERTRALAHRRRFESSLESWAYAAETAAEEQTKQNPALSIALVTKAMTEDERHDAARQLQRGAAALRSLANQLLKES